MNIILIGPQESGKTINSAEIARSFGCARIFDGTVPRRIPTRRPHTTLTPKTTDCLVISHKHPRNPDDGRVPLPGIVVTVEQARERLGAKWIGQGDTNEE